MTPESLMNLLYTLFLHLFGLCASLAARFNEKARLFVQAHLLQSQRKESAKSMVYRGRKWAWHHEASF